MSGLLTSLLERGLSHGDRPAIVAGGQRFTYRDLDQASSRVAGALLAGRQDLDEARVAFLVSPGFAYAAMLWGIWRAGGIAVPLAVSHPAAELEHVIGDAAASVVVADAGFAGLLSPLAQAIDARFAHAAELLEGPASRLPTIPAGRRALILYTSGTTGKPKGVVTTHANLAAQVSSLVDAWEWAAGDRTLLVLPLHHVHGIVNVLACALWAGALCEVHPGFEAEATWERLASGELTVFTAVPTIYRRLISSWETSDPSVRARRSHGCNALRLMMSGSAPLPVQTLERWKEISGQVLLERYGMTEIGMALSNPIPGERRPGFVGTPLPGVVVQLVDETGEAVAPGVPGEIEVRGPAVFLEYWRDPAATSDAFREGWFRTGDVAVLEEGAYRILGRTSIDIIKTGGYKVSALEIEEILRTHPAVAECAVVGIDHPEWGEQVCAALEVRGQAQLALGDLQGWAKARLAPYKVPKDLRCVSTLPRNAMGKIVKREVAALFAPRRRSQ